MRCVFIIVLWLTMGVGCKQKIRNLSKSELINKVDSNVYIDKMVRLANGDTSHRWPVAAPIPLKGAILPYNRIVAFYGDLYDDQLGVLGEFKKRDVLDKLKSESIKWQEADPATPVIMALHCIAIVAWDEANIDGKYRNREPLSQIDTLINWAKEINGLVFLDMELGNSSIKEELPAFEEYLKKGSVHLGIDPEFSFKNGPLPKGGIGTIDASDINYAIDYLAALVKKYHLPPKILVIHRFNEEMVTNYKSIKKIPEVQIVMDMDGFGTREDKLASYQNYIFREPVQFTGFKLFYKQDIRDSLGLMKAPEILRLVPAPIYIQYQ